MRPVPQGMDGLYVYTYYVRSNATGVSSALVGTLKVTFKGFYRVRLLLLCT